MTIRFASAAALALLAAACSSSPDPGPDSTEVGAVCTMDEDCDNVCLMANDFGGGMCSQPCSVEDPCPSGSVCVQVGTGMCAVGCSTAADCSDFPDDWTCGTEDAVEGGQAMVCRIP